MKKILVLAFAVLCAISAIAADVDILIKTNSEKIEAIIQEVSDTDVKYKKASNPTGPTYIIKISELATIIYSNGDVQAIAPTQSQPAVQPQQQQQQPQPQQQPASNGTGYNYNTECTYNMYFEKTGPMQRVGYDEYIIENRRLKGKELNYFLQENCPVANDYHKKWQRTEVAGWCMLGLGAGFSLGIGLGCMLWTELGTGNQVAYKTGAAFVAIGGAMVLSSVPPIVCGMVFKNRTHKVFNDNCGQPQAFQPELKLTSGPNGLGLALSF